MSTGGTWLIENGKKVAAVWGPGGKLTKVATDKPKPAKPPKVEGE